jgi:hypothetical protein
MGGEIGVESVEGEGSRFWFTVRFEKQVVQVETTQASESYLSGLRVLVVDDNATNRTILINQIGSLEMIAGEAKDGRVRLICCTRRRSAGNLTSWSSRNCV